MGTLQKPVDCRRHSGMFFFISCPLCAKERAEAGDIVDAEFREIEPEPLKQLPSTGGTTDD